MVNQPVLWMEVSGWDEQDWEGQTPYWEIPSVWNARRDFGSPESELLLSVVISFIWSLSLGNPRADTFLTGLFRWYLHVWLNYWNIFRVLLWVFRQRSDDFLKEWNWKKIQCYLNENGSFSVSLDIHILLFLLFILPEITLFSDSYDS